MADRVAEFVVRVGGDGSDLLAVLDKLKGSVKSAALDLEKTTAQVDLFKNTKAKAEETGKAFLDLTDRAAEFRRQIAQIEGEGGKVGKELTDALKATEKQLAQTSREYDRQANAVAKLEASLTKAGVDTTRLADEEARLAAATKEAARQAQIQAAQQALGVKSTKDTTAEIARLNAAYRTLRDNGASVNELAQAQRNLTTQVVDLQRNTGGLVERLSSARLAVLGYAAAFAGLAAAAKAAADATLDFEKQTAQIGTVTNLTEREVADLTDGVRRLAQSAGFDLTNGLKAAYDLLRQGVPAGNVLEVLALADDAAKAGLTELGTTAKLVGTLIRGFGVEVSQVKPILDGLFVAAKNGGATFEELAAGLGDLAPVAKATRTPVRDVAAAIQVMTKAGLDAPTAISQLTQILTRLASPETVTKLRALGIETTGLVDTLRAIGERNLSIGTIIDLGVSSSRAAAGVAALTSDSAGLAAALDAIGGSSGALDKASESLNNLRSESVERLVASLKNLQITLGQIVTPSAQTINSLSQLVQLLDNLARRGQSAASGLGSLGGQALTIAQRVAGLTTPIGLLQEAFGALGAAAEAANVDLAAAAAQATDTSDQVGRAAGRVARAAADQAEAARTQLAALRAQLAAVIPELDAAGKTITQSTQAAIDAINTQATARLAGLDKLRNSEQAITEQTIAIQADAAAKRLAIIQKGAADAIGVANAEAKARLELARSQGQDLVKVEQQIAADKRDVLAGIVKQYQAHLSELLKLETEHLNNVARINDQRVDFNRAIEDKIKAIRGDSLSAFEQYAEKVRVIDENISKSREALARGDLTRAEDFAKKAIELSEGISKKVEADGRVVIGQFEAQGLAIGKIREAQDLYNRSLDERVDAEKEGAKTTADNLKTTQEGLAAVKAQLDEVNAIIGKGLQVTIDTNAAEAVADARREILSLDGLNTSSTHTIRVVTVEGNASGGVVGEKLAAIRSSLPYARGAVQRFARGGGVFRRPVWSKVPGVGDQDTVPAGLQAGSFVVRKAASRYYGDALLGRLDRVQHFALGGPATALPALGRSLSDFVLRGLLARLGGSGGTEVDGVNVVELQRELTSIVEAARGLPHSSTGLDVGAWASALLERIPYLPSPKLKILAEAIKDEIEGILSGIQQARSFNAASVVGEKLLGLLFLRAGGAAPEGRGTDTVPAMLTPGEWVIRKQAVDHFGSGLLHAINGMRIPRETLARLVQGPAAPAAPRYFADGGAVTAGATSVSSSGAGGDGSRSVVFNVTIQSPGKITPEDVRRYIIPPLRDEMRRTR